MGIFTEKAPKGLKKSWTKEEDQALIEYRKGRYTISEIAARLSRTDSSVKYRIRFLKYVKKMYGSLIHYKRRNKIHVSPAKWTKEADRELIKKSNRDWRADERGYRRLKVLMKKEREMNSGYRYWENISRSKLIDILLNHVHQKVVPSFLFLQVMEKYKGLVKSNNELKQVAAELKNQFAKLAA